MSEMTKMKNWIQYKKKIHIIIVFSTLGQHEQDIWAD